MYPILAKAKPLLLAVVLSWACCGAAALAGPLADWQFQAPANSPLGAIPDTIGKVKFEGHAPGVAVADGVLRIRRPMPETASVYAALPSLPKNQPLWLVTELAGWSFAGKPGESVSFGFCEDKMDPELALSGIESTDSPVAEARLWRNRTGGVHISGRADGGLGATKVLAGPGLAVAPEEKKTTFIALSYDAATATYAVLVKSQGEAWRLVGRGATDPRLHARFVRLVFGSVMNDTATEGVNIHRITVATAPPEDLGPGVLDVPFLTAPLWAVSDAATGEIIGGQGVDTPAKVASINKTMTTYVICKLVEKDPKVLDEIITATPKSEAFGGSSSHIPAGDKLPVRDALYSFMLPSGNDMGVLFAQHFSPRLAPPEDSQAIPNIPADIVNFIAEMNRQARALGMTHSIFRKPYADGGTVADRTTTPRDLLVLAREAMKLPLFKQVVGTAHYAATLTKADGSTRTLEWENTNRLLGHLGVNGIKTGTDVAAKACLLSSRVAEDGRSYFAVVLGIEAYERRFLDTRSLLEWAARHKGKPPVILPPPASLPASAAPEDRPATENTGEEK